MTYLKELNENVQVSNAPATLWGKYVKTNFIRSDKRGIKYASNLFSMQITLAHLSQSQAKIALINDIYNPVSNQSVDRYICLLRGDGQGGFSPISSQELQKLQAIENDDPIIVFGGCIHSNTMNKDSLKIKMQPWLHNFTQLVLACDTSYPQFFKANEDHTFDSTPIYPTEKILQDIIETHSSLGTHIKDPSLYCLVHIHPASLPQVLNNSNHPHSIPAFSIGALKEHA